MGKVSCPGPAIDELSSNSLHYKMRDETYRAFENIYPVLTEFKKTML